VVFDVAAPVINDITGFVVANNVVVEDVDAVADVDAVVAGDVVADVAVAVVAVVTVAFADVDVADVFAVVADGMVDRC
jgi:hypothetical protein